MSSSEEHEMAEMTKRIDSLGAYKRSIIGQLKALNQRGKELQAEFGELADRLRVEREPLNQLFAKLKENKENRSALVTKLREIKEQARTVGTTLRGFEKGVFGEDDKVLTAKLNTIEWKLQTERLTREEERELVEYVRELESKLRRYRKITSTRHEYKDIMADFKDLRDTIDEIDVASDELRNEIGKRKEIVHQLVMQRQQILDEIKEQGRDIGELRQQLDTAYSEFEQIRRKRNDLIISMKSRDNETMMLKRRAFLEKARDDAKSKLQAGMTLSFDELKLALDGEV